MSLASLKQTAWQIKNKLLPGCVILMYHRVADVDSDPWSLCVSPKHFAQHLAVLQAYGSLVSLQTLTQRLRQGDPVQRSVAITFDDGYADNLQYAKPLLCQYATPATMFIATGGLQKPEEFWWDSLDRLFLQPGELPAKLQLQVNDTEYTWDLGEAAYYSLADYLRLCHWQAESEEPPSPRQALYLQVYFVLQMLSEDDRMKAIQQLYDWAKVDSTARRTHRTLTPSEATELEEQGFIDIGAHTVTHPHLAKLPLDQQKEEILKSKEELESILGHAVESFSYPHGSYTEATRREVEAAGFFTACCSRYDRVSRRSHPLELPRIVVQNWDGNTFARWMAQWI
jgi:peptidoglycan/xylan/chitin deacetylase (PgdA/CDA1 family)